VTVEEGDCEVVDTGTEGDCVDSLEEDVAPFVTASGGLILARVAETTDEAIGEDEDEDEELLFDTSVVDEGTECSSFFPVVCCVAIVTV
jgi:hypothetical protein